MGEGSTITGTDTIAEAITNDIKSKISNAESPVVQAAL